MTNMNVAEASPQSRTTSFNRALWIEKADTLLDVHRAHFLFREPSAGELEMHKAALEVVIAMGRFLQSLLGDSEISVRLGLLQDAYILFHDSTFSEPEAERLLATVFRNESSP